MHVLLSLGLVLLVACSQSRGVFKLGPDTYITSAAASPTAGVTEAQRLALTEANEYCANMGKKIKVMKSSDVINIYGGGTSKVTFQCLTRDPSLQRPGARNLWTLRLKTGENEAHLLLPPVGVKPMWR